MADDPSVQPTPIVALTPKPASANGHRHNVLTSFEQIPKPGDDRPIIEVPVPEWRVRNPETGKPEAMIVCMRAMDEDAREDWELRGVKDWNVEPDPEIRMARARSRTLEDITRGMKALLVAQHVVDPAGRRVMSDAQAAQLQQANAAAVNRLAEMANELSGFSQQDLNTLAKKLLSAQDSETPSI